MKTSKSNLKQPIIFAKIIAVSIAVFLCASCDNGNGKRLAKAKNDPAGTYREYLSDIRRQKKLSIKELAGHLKQWQTLRLLTGTSCCLRQEKETRHNGKYAHHQCIFIY